MTGGGVFESAVDVTGSFLLSWLSDPAEIAELAAQPVEGGTKLARQLTATGADNGR